MSSVVYVSDFFLNEIIGGGELNDDEMLKNLSSTGCSVSKIKSSNLTLSTLRSLRDTFFIISNFCMVRKECIEFLTNNCKYIIYEHDHKYLINRNPAEYPDFKAPRQNIVNADFYKNAVAVFCQSILHKNIIKKNLGISNLYNVSGNFWSEESLVTLEKCSKSEKQDVVAIMNSQNWHKNTMEAVKFCELKGIKFNLIESASYSVFLQNMSKNKKLMFFPKTPETLSRICVEARMMNMSVVANKNVGASYEDWFSLKGVKLVDLMRRKKKTVTSDILEYVNGK
tara:strand:- start:1590 stop:2438 length:849 start_codon:yes stop_codon:yes gene_type:complete